MSDEFTFLGQLQPKLAMLVGQLPMLAYQVMKHVGPGVVHALQMYWDLKYQQRNLVCQLS
jgi:hypothetical protein